MATITPQKLFEPGRIGSLELKNRIVMAPLGTRLCGIWGEVTDRLLAWYRLRAKGGCGLVVVQASHVATALDPFKVQPRMLRADDDAFCPGLFQVVEAIHDAGAKAAIQLVAGYGAQAMGAPWVLGRQYIDDITPVSPSSIPSPSAMLSKQRPPRELTAGEIAKIVELMGKAAERAKLVGFDMIEIHASGGMLVEQFLSPYFNKRTDGYGGSVDGRARFLLELVDSVRRQVGPDYPLISRLTVNEFIEGGIDAEQGLRIASRLEEAGIGGIHVAQGIFGSKEPIMGTMYHAEGYTLSLAESLKRQIKIPIIASGRLGDPQLAERALVEGKADFVGLGRPLIADPDWPRKAAADGSEPIRMCISCGDCWERMNRYKETIRCTVNPIAGREVEHSVLKPAERTKKVIVVGAGPAGMEAARVAALRGHNVKLYEKGSELGGQLRIASVPPHKQVLNWITSYYSSVFGQLQNVEVTLDKMVSPDDIVAEKPDAVIVATGGKPHLPDIPGIDLPNVVRGEDVLAGNVRTGNNVLVVGGGMVGCEIANFLAGQGKKVTIIEMLGEICGDMERVSRQVLTEELARGKVKVMTGASIDALTEEGVLANHKVEGRIVIKADTIVLALGARPAGELANNLMGKIPRVRVVGDAREPRRIREAIYDGFVAANDL